jgi:hypothetical protein
MKNSKYIVSVVALSLLIASCDNNNELPENELGKAIPVRIHSLGMAAGNSEGLTRASSQKESEMVSSPVGDGMLLEMSIERDASSLRLGTLEYLVEGTYFRVIAVEAGTTNYYSHGDFVVGGESYLTSFYVHIGNEYDFICFSYNDDQPFSTSYTPGDPLPTPFDVDNTKDLLWWQSPASVTVTSSGVELDIKLEQKLAKVRVIVDCNYNKWKITDITTNKITIGSVATSGTINWLTGDLTAGSTADRGFTWSDITTDASQQTSDSLWVMPKASGTITVKILAGAISRNGLTSAPANDKPVTFTTALIAGVSYTIHIRLRTTIWARSNIYWEGNASSGYLTFVRAGTDVTKEGFQGLFFKFGSLFGISPEGVANSAFTNTTPVYSPNSSTPITNLSWDAIPRWNKAYGNVVNNDHTDQSVGDICEYLDSDYRLPKLGEFGTTNFTWDARQEGWVYSGSVGSADIGDAFGRYNLISNSRIFARNTTMDNVRFPAPGHRSYNAGELIGKGNGGNYWIGLAYDSEYDEAYMMSFMMLGLNASAHTSVHNAGSVRCVKK